MFLHLPLGYPLGYYFYSPQSSTSSTVIKSKMAATTIRTRTRFRPLNTPALQASGFTRCFTSINVSHDFHMNFTWHSHRLGISRDGYYSSKLVGVLLVSISFSCTRENDLVVHIPRIQKNNCFRWRHFSLLAVVWTVNGDWMKMLQSNSFGNSR